MFDTAVDQFTFVNFGIFFSLTVLSTTESHGLAGTGMKLHYPRYPVFFRLTGYMGYCTSG